MDDTTTTGPSAWEDAVRAAVWRAIQSSTTSTSESARTQVFEYGVTLLLDELTESQRLSIPADEVQTLIEDVMDNTDGIDEDQPGALCQAIEMELAATQAELESEEDSEAECGLCERELKLTRHHVIPRAVHKEYRKRGSTIQQLSKTVSICRPCHSAVHRFISEKELAARYNSLEELRAHEQVRKFAQWNSKQKVRAKTTNTGRYALDRFDEPP